LGSQSVWRSAERSRQLHQDSFAAHRAHPFWTTYLLLLALFFHCEKTFTNLLVFSVLGYLCYYTFNTEVHENHLFLVAILAVVLHWRGGKLAGKCSDPFVNDQYQPVLVLRRGWGFAFSPLFAGIDIALVLAILNVRFFIYLYGVVLAEYLQPLWAAQNDNKTAVDADLPITVWFFALGLRPATQPRS
jgi:hypothetical protein